MTTSERELIRLHRLVGFAIGTLEGINILLEAQNAQVLQQNAEHIRKFIPGVLAELNSTDPSEQPIKKGEGTYVRTDIL